MIGVISFWFIPNYPNTTGSYFLTAEEAEMAAYRQTVSAGGLSEDDEGDYWSGVWTMLKDPFAHMFALIHFSIIIAQSYKDFFPSVRVRLHPPTRLHMETLTNLLFWAQILATLGFDEIITYLIQVPPPVIAFMVTLAVSWHSGRVLEYAWHMVVPILLTAVGCAVMITTLNVGGRYFAMILLVTGPFAALNVSHPNQATSPPVALVYDLGPLTSGL